MSQEKYRPNEFLEALKRAFKERPSTPSDKSKDQSTVDPLPHRMKLESPHRNIVKILILLITILAGFFLLRAFFPPYPQPALDTPTPMPTPLPDTAFPPPSPEPEDSETIERLRVIQAQINVAREKLLSNFREGSRFGNTSPEDEEKIKELWKEMETLKRKKGSIKK